jgi:hypothetical protein
MTENRGIDVPAFVACIMGIININLSYIIFMEDTTYHIRIKKGYAADIIKGLQKLNAVEVLPGEELPIQEWQKKEVRKRLKDLQKNPKNAISWQDATKKIKQLAK